MCHPSATANIAACESKPADAEAICDQPQGTGAFGLPEAPGPVDKDEVGNPNASKSLEEYEKAAFALLQETEEKKGPQAQQSWPQETSSCWSFCKPEEASHEPCTDPSNTSSEAWMW